MPFAAKELVYRGSKRHGVKHKRCVEILPTAEVKSTRVALLHSCVLDQVSTQRGAKPEFAFDINYLYRNIMKRSAWQNFAQQLLNANSDSPARCSWSASKLASHASSLGELRLAPRYTPRKLMMNNILMTDP